MAKTPYESNTLAVSVVEAKNYCKVTHTTDDALFDVLIRGAMQWVENFCDTSFTEDCDNDDISDFFNDEALASKWTASGDVSEAYHPGALYIPSGGTDLDSLIGAWQHLTGDFDVRIHVKLPDGALAASSGVQLLALMDDENAVAARYETDAAGAYFLGRYDTVYAVENSTTGAHANVQDFYLRLRRSGGRFYVYGKTWNTDAWTAVAAPATELITSGPVQLWITAFHGTAFEAWIDWIVENSEYANWPLPYCFEGSSSGSGHRLWGECAEPICCLPMWLHPCTGETLDIPPAVKAAILQLVRRMYDNRGGVTQESVAGWAVTWLDLVASDIALMLEQFRSVGT